MSESDPITRLNEALEGHYKIERELGEGGMATGYGEVLDLRHVVVQNFFEVLRERIPN